MSDADGPPGVAGEHAEPNKIDETDALYQTTVIAWGNLAILVVVWVLLRYGYEEPRDVPVLFTVAQLFVFGVGFTTLYARQAAEAISRMWDPDDPFEPRGWLKWWLDRRPRIQPFIVFALAAIVLASLTYLVWVTGLAIESPFVPLAAAPAVFGPFVARKRKEVVVGLVAIVIVLLGLIALEAPTSACGPDACDSDGEMTAHEPDAFVYYTTTVTVLLIVGWISANKLAVEKRMRTRIRTLEREVERLRRRDATYDREGETPAG